MEVSKRSLFCKKAPQKTFTLGPWALQLSGMTGGLSGTGRKRTKVFGAPFFKKARPCFLAARKGVDARFRGHDGVGVSVP